MKKIVKLLSVLVLSIFSFTGVYAATGDLESSGATTYKYYYGQGCAYCAKVDRYLKSVDASSKIDIVKNEIYYEKENAASMMADGKRLGIDQKDIGVPFLIIKKDGVETPLIGDRPIIEYFTPILGEPKESNNKGIILAILGVLAILVPVFLIKMSNKN